MYNPGITYDASPIERGLSNFGQGLADGLLERSKKREEAEKLQALRAYFEPVVNRMSGGKVSVAGAPKEAIPMLYKRAIELEQIARDAPLQELELENVRLRNRLSQRALDEAATNALALQEAYQPWKGVPYKKPTSQGALETYVRRGGTDPKIMDQLSTAALAQQERDGSRINFTEDPISGKRFATYGNQMQPSGLNPKLTSATPDVRKIVVGGATYFVGPGDRYFDAEGRPITFGSAGPRLGGLLDGDTSPVGLNAEDQAALDWADRNPNDPRAAKIRQKLGLN